MGCIRIFAIFIAVYLSTSPIIYAAHSHSHDESYFSNAATGMLLNGLNGDPGVYPGTYHGASEGWPFMPDISTLAGALLDTSSLLVGDQGDVLTHYITANFTPSNIKRAVILVHGEDRPSWNMQIYGTKALQRAVTGGDVKEEEVVILSPQFFIDIDKGAYSVDDSGISNSEQMIWSAEDNGWGMGDTAIEPANSKVGSFEALDAVLAIFHNTTQFPALKNVVIAGFSMGAQLVQRYSVFRNDTSQDGRTKYWISSPASFVYLNNSRPASSSAISSCSRYNEYKYGLDGNLPSYVDTSISEAAVAKRYFGRSLNFLVGIMDYLGSDHSCSAKLQGDSHVIKMYNWVTYVVPYLAGSSNSTLPSTSTIDYINNIGHDPYLIFNSDPGIQRLFLDDYNGPGQDAAAPKSNGYTSIQPTKSSLKHTSTDNDVGRLKSPFFSLVSYGLLLSTAFHLLL